METPTSTGNEGDLPPPRTDARVALPVLGGILAAAAAIRVRGGWNDLWLDEIWSLELAREVHAPLDVFVRFHHEINHYLNTLWLWLAGGEAGWLVYRVPSLVAGVGTVAIAARIAWRRGPAAVYFTTIAVSCSYLLVLYSSEVRGYASLVFFSFACFLLIEAYQRRDDPRLGVAFAALRRSRAALASALRERAAVGARLVPLARARASALRPYGRGADRALLRASGARVSARSTSPTYAISSSVAAARPVR